MFLLQNLGPKLVWSSNSCSNQKVSKSKSKKSQLFQTLGLWWKIKFDQDFLYPISEENVCIRREGKDEREKLKAITEKSERESRSNLSPQRSYEFSHH